MATLRQETAVRKVIENIRSKKGKTMNKILKESGYSEKTSNNPTMITNTTGWKELMEKYLPDKKLQEKHKQLLNAGKLTKDTYKADEISEEDVKEVFRKSDTKIVKLIKREIRIDEDRVETVFDVYYKQDDNMTQREMLKESYKLKGRYEPTAVTIAYKDLTDDELKRKAASVLTDLTSDLSGVEDTAIGKLIEELRTE